MERVGMSVHSLPLSYLNSFSATGLKKEGKAHSCTKKNSGKIADE